MPSNSAQQDTDPSEWALCTGLGNYLLGRHKTFSYGEMEEETWAGAGGALGDTPGAQGNS